MKPKGKKEAAGTYAPMKFSRITVMRIAAALRVLI
jgi:hypothetical protein